MEFSGLERALEKRGRELMRILLQEYLDKLGPGIASSLFSVQTELSGRK